MSNINFHSDTPRVESDFESDTSEDVDIAHILIVDDNEFDRKRLSRAMDKSQVACKITQAPDLPALRLELERNRFDLILIDYALEDGTGFDALQTCRNSHLNETALCVMVTGNDSSALAVNALKQGFDDYLKKDDFSFTSIYALLEESRLKRHAKLKSAYMQPFVDTHIGSASFAAEHLADLTKRYDEVPSASQSSPKPTSASTLAAFAEEEEDDMPSHYFMWKKLQ